LNERIEIQPDPPAHIQNSSSFGSSILSLLGEDIYICYQISYYDYWHPF